MQGGSADVARTSLVDENIKVHIPIDDMDDENNDVILSQDDDSISPTTHSVRNEP